VQALLKADERVGAYQYDGMWFDIGRRDDYERAVSAWIDETDEEAEASEVAARTV
jgi:NDP-sugar pyrophosphorylase family protein